VEADAVGRLELHGQVRGREAVGGTPYARANAREKAASDP
jgi:hypothetical protein